MIFFSLNNVGFNRRLLKGIRRKLYEKVNFGMAGRWSLMAANNLNFFNSSTKKVRF